MVLNNREITYQLLHCIIYSLSQIRIFIFCSGQRAAEFEVVVRESASIDRRLEASILSVDGNKVKIIGNSGVAVAWAFHHYLKYFCDCHISWETSQLSLPSPLPPVNTSLVSQDQHRSVL